MNDAPRKLPYPLLLPNTISEVTPDDEIVYFTPDLFPQDPDEKILVGLNLSLNDYVTLASAIDVGRDIAYNEQSISVWQLWVSILRQASGMFDCTDVADCLNDPVVFNVLINNAEFVENLVNNQEFYETIVQNPLLFPDNIDPAETTGSQRLPDYQEPIRELPEPCDLDELWAGIREMVERIDEQGRDLLEDLANLNDKAERIKGLIDLVPLLGDIIADVANFFTETIPDLLNAYNAYSSTSAMDVIACDLFQLVCNECRYPTYEEVFNYYGNLGAEGIPNFQVATYLALWTGVKVVSAVPAPVYFSVNAWQVFTYGFGGLWNGSYGKNTFNIWASFGEEFANDNWQVLCGACLECTNYNFLIDEQGWGTFVLLDNRGYGIWDDGWIDQDRQGASNSRYLTIREVDSGTFDGMNSVSMIYNLTNPITDPIGEGCRIELWYQDALVQTIGNNTSGAGTGVVLSGAVTVPDFDEVRIIFAMQFPNAVKVTSIEVCP